MSDEKPRKPAPWLRLSRYSWFVMVGVVLAGKDACLGGGKRPDPVPPPAASAAPAQVATSPTPAPPPPTAPTLPPPG